MIEKHAVELITAIMEAKCSFLGTRFVGSDAWSLPLEHPRQASKLGATEHGRGKLVLGVVI
jgi:hypothetical protein